ncbi:hypothetical protein JCGZ_14154 [Jatropha curcas]|uniref:Uncharacterized protein n=1 Tax=Jatropha curcas TaxID=180498 RepID=A0A067K015_JATCU|nr:hypothetical protein JCGZ_14154 [Jatropha curcas]
MAAFKRAAVLCVIMMVMALTTVEAKRKPINLCGGFDPHPPPGGCAIRWPCLRSSMWG